jgi:hypothetical protein
VPAIAGTGEGGICLSAQNLFDPIIFVDQTENFQQLKLNKGLWGVLEHEIGHALGLDDQFNKPKGVMHGVHPRQGNDLTPQELQTIRTSPLLQDRPVEAGNPSII